MKLLRTLLKNNTDGFTLIETLMTVFLFGILAVTVAGGIIIGQQALNRIITSSYSSLNLMQEDSYLRGLIAKIRLPYWLSELKYKYLTDSLEIPYLDGKADKYLVIKNEEKGFFIGYRDESKKEGSEELEGTREKLTYFGPYWENSLKIEEEDGIIKSVTLLITREKNAEEVEIYAVLSCDAFWFTGP